MVRSTYARRRPEMGFGTKNLVLRESQEKLAAKISEAWTHTNSVLFQGPTGVGKTELALFFAKHPDARVMFATSRASLIGQTIKRAKQYGIKSVRVNDLEPWKVWPKEYTLIVGHPTSIRNRLLDNSEAFPTLLILDEAHHAAHRKELPATRTNIYTQLLARAVNNGIKVLGLTATPNRLEPELGFERWFGELVVSPSANHFVELGELAPIQVTANDLMRGGIKEEKTFEEGPNGDFTERSITDVKDYIGRLQEAISFTGAAFNFGEGVPVKSLLFCVTQATATEVALLLRYKYPNIRVGLKLSNSDYYTEPRDREIICGDDALEAFRRGNLDALVNVAVLTEGADFPTAEGLAMLRPTRSITLWRQVAGRLSRPADGKKAGLLLDLAGNLQRLGHPYDDYEWSLQATIDKHYKAQWMLDQDKLTAKIEKLQKQVQEKSAEIQSLKVRKVEVVRQITTPEMHLDGGGGSYDRSVSQVEENAEPTNETPGLYFQTPEAFYNSRQKLFPKDQMHEHAGTVHIGGKMYRVTMGYSVYWYEQDQGSRTKPRSHPAQSWKDGWADAYAEYVRISKVRSGRMS